MAFSSHMQMTLCSSATKIAPLGIFLKAPWPGFDDCLCINTFCSSCLIYPSSLNTTHTSVVLLSSAVGPITNFLVVTINKLIQMCQWTTCLKNCGSKSTIELNHDIFRIKKTCLYSIFQPSMKTSQSPCRLNIDCVIWTNTLRLNSQTQLIARSIPEPFHALVSLNIE